MPSLTWANRHWRGGCYRLVSDSVVVTLGGQLPQAWPLRPSAVSEVIPLRRFWSSVVSASDLAMPVAESGRASCCPAGSRGACCDNSGLCQGGSKAEAMVLLL